LSAERFAEEGGRPVSAIRVWRAKKTLRRLIAAWEEFGKILSQASQEEEIIRQDVDKGLLDLEARIAVDLPCMYELFTGTYLDDEIREEVRSVSELVKRYTGKSLSGRLTHDEAKGMMAEWNSHFVFMNRLLGSKLGAERHGEEMGLEAAQRARRPGAFRKIGQNSALRFFAKALVVIILLVVVVNLFGGTASDLFSGAVKQISGVHDSGVNQPDFEAGSLGDHLLSWRTKAQVFTAEHRRTITLAAIVVAAFAVLYLILYRGS
jgi:hypothetical protein